MTSSFNNFVIESSILAILHTSYNKGSKGMGCAFDLPTQVTISGCTVYTVHVHESQRQDNTRQRHPKTYRFFWSYLRRDSKPHVHVHSFTSYYGLLPTLYKTFPNIYTYMCRCMCTYVHVYISMPLSSPVAIHVHAC